MRFEPAILVTTVSTWSLILAAPSIHKRQGLFSCYGWGAGCSSSWRVPRPMPKPQPPPPPKQMPARHNVRRFWLTSENAWGPSGKRSISSGKVNKLSNLKDILNLLQQDQHQSRR